MLQPQDITNLLITASFQRHYLHFSVVLSYPLEIILLKRIYTIPKIKLVWPDRPIGSLFHPCGHYGFQTRWQEVNKRTDTERSSHAAPGCNCEELQRQIPMCLEEMSPASSWLLACGDLCRTEELLLTLAGWQARGLKLPYFSDYNTHSFPQFGRKMGVRLIVRM